MSSLLLVTPFLNFASFPPIESHVKRISGSIRFHFIDGIDMKTAYPRDEVEKSGLEGKTRASGP